MFDTNKNFDFIRRRLYKPILYGNNLMGMVDQLLSYFLISIYSFSANTCIDLTDPHGTWSSTSGNTAEQLTLTCTAGYEVNSVNQVTHTLVCNADGTTHTNYPLPTCTGKYTHP